jgi:hypothetical protein
VRMVKSTVSGLMTLALLAGCATAPLGPTVAVYPPANRPPDVFANDDASCRGYAQNAVSGTVQQANSNAAGTAIIGTVLGAGLGAALGGGRGAAIGAASGAVIGTGIGANQNAYSQLTIQQQYDVAYGGCMHSHGYQVPAYIAGYPVYVVPAPAYIAPPVYAPPPPGYPPPPEQ